MSNPISNSSEPVAGMWNKGPLPPRVSLGSGTTLTGEQAFKRFFSMRDDGLVIGSQATMEGVHFAVGPQGHIKIGNYCYFTNVVLLCDLELNIGNYVMIGWNTTIADTDFHPLDAAERIADAIACSPLAGSRPRPEVARRPVIIEDDVWIGPNATILKGVRIGRGAFIEAGSLVTRDVSAGVRVMGNPAKVIGEVA